MNITEKIDNKSVEQDYAGMGMYHSKDKDAMNEKIVKALFEAGLYYPEVVEDVVEMLADAGIDITAEELLQRAKNIDELDIITFDDGMEGIGMSKRAEIKARLGEDVEQEQEEEVPTATVEESMNMPDYRNIVEENELIKKLIEEKGAEYVENQLHEAILDEVGAKEVINNLLNYYVDDEAIKEVVEKVFDVDEILGKDDEVEDDIDDEYTGL